MSTAHLMVVHCDEQLTGDCAGVVEYRSPDRMGLAQWATDHTLAGQWLRGSSRTGSYDVCPSCRAVMQTRARHPVAARSESEGE